MNITRETIDELNAVLKIQISKEDYAEKVESTLNDYKKKARIDGFRPGKVPTGLVKKMYGKPVLIEEVNKLVLDGINNHIKEEKVNILGEPLPNEELQKEIDWDTQSDFEFVFDLGLAPAIEIKLSKRDKVTLYNIAIDQDMKDGFIQNQTRRFGEFVKVDTIEENERVTGKLEQIDGEIVVEDSIISVDSIKDEEITKQFIGAKVEDIIDFDIRKAFTEDYQLASVLGMKKEETEEVNGTFRFTISEITRFQNAEVNQELFDKIYGEGVINSEEEYNNKVIAEISGNLIKDTNYKLSLDIKEKLVNKIQFNLPENFLKRWLHAMNEGKFTMEQIEKEFPLFAEDFKWQMIKDTIIKEQELKVEDKDIIELAKEITASQFAQYGMFDLTDEQLTQFSSEILKNQEQVKKMYERAYEDKVVAYVKDAIKIEEKEISREEFGKFFQQ